MSFRSQPHKRDEVLSAVDEAISRMRKAPGCDRCRLFVDTDDSNSFCVLSEWRLSEAADTFFESRDFQIFRHIRILLREQPVIEIDQVERRARRVIETR